MTAGIEIDNGKRLRLVIEGVFDGTAGVAGGYVSFVPNRNARKPDEATGGTLDGKGVLLAPAKDPHSEFWLSRYRFV